MQSRSLALVYLVLGLVGLVLTWSQNLAYFGPASSGGFTDFLRGTVANPGARSVAFDILIVGWSASIWMVIEGRRRRMKGVWLFPVMGWTLAMAFAIPLFLAARELALRTPPEIEGRPSPLDGLGLGILSAFALVLLVLGVRAAGLI
ncbi:MAG: DUF2834 domain-containing protein [Phenylobacterium sp.]|uniref:DUF2834 domain-containing protein n=1 Tax=Phenylobacterium sp. TaxID=1871053 RepID=UPI0030178F41